MDKRSVTRQKQRRAEEAQSVSAILPLVGRNLGLDRKVQEWSVLSLWDQVIDPAFEGKTKALKIRVNGKQNRLVVGARHSAVATELTFFTETYRTRLNTYANQTGVEIHAIDIQVT